MEGPAGWGPCRGALAHYKVPASLQEAPHAACGSVPPAGIGTQRARLWGRRAVGACELSEHRAAAGEGPRHRVQGGPGGVPMHSPRGAAHVCLSACLSTGPPSASPELGARRGGGSEGRAGAGSRRWGGLLRLRGGVSTGLGWWVGHLVLLAPSRGVQTQSQRSLYCAFAKHLDPLPALPFPA